MNLASDIEVLHGRLQVTYEDLRAADARMDSMQLQIDELLKQLPEDTSTRWHEPLSDEEFELVTRVVMAESGNQPFAGQVGVAQCIHDRMHRDNMSATEVVCAKNQFAEPYPYEVTQSVRDAVLAVFRDGHFICEEPLYYFYSTVGGFTSAMHESKHYVMTIDDHKFFN